MRSLIGAIAWLSSHLCAHPNKRNIDLAVGLAAFARQDSNECVVGGHSLEQPVRAVAFHLALCYVPFYSSCFTFVL